MAARHEIDRQAHTSAPPEVVYAMLLDRPSWPTWSPLDGFVHERDGEDGPNSLGAIGTFSTGRKRSREEIVELIPHHRLSYTLLSGLPLHGYRADIDIRPDATGQLAGCTIRWHSTFGARPGTGWIYRFALGTFIQRMVDGLAAAADAKAVTAA